MNRRSWSGKLPHDWHPGSIPPNIEVCHTAYLSTSYNFHAYYSTASVGLRMGRGASLCDMTVLDVGPQGRVSLGDYAHVTGGGRIICDSEVDIGDYALIGWNVLIMDTYRVPGDVEMRRHELERSALTPERRLVNDGEPRPVRIGRNVWVGFEACILPGVVIGEGAVIGARSVVRENVPPYTVVAGNPARIVRILDR